MSMELRMRCAQVQVQRLELVAPHGFETCLPQAEKWLETSKCVVSVPEPLAVQFRSVMDVLVCTVWKHEELAACRRFYDGEGEPLRAIRSPGVLADYDRGIVRALQACYRPGFRRGTVSLAELRGFSIENLNHFVAIRHIM